jgi:hypothetical protein
MSVEVEKNSPAETFSSHFLEHHGVEINFEGIIPSEDNENTLLWGIVSELLDNCVENRIPGSDAKPQHINVTFEEGRITMEDDFVYENPEEVLETINKFIEAGGGTTKPPHPDFDFPIGGWGIALVLNMLQKSGGGIKYEIKDGTIKTIATWNTEKIKLFHNHS